MRKVRSPKIAAVFGLPDPTAGGTSGEAAQAALDAVFKQLDKNEDQFITRKELAALAKELTASQKEAAEKLLPKNEAAEEPKEKTGFMLPKKEAAEEG